MNGCKRSTSSTTLPATFSPENLIPVTSLDLQKRSVSKPLCRQKRRGTFSGHGLRLRKEGAGPGRRSGPATPLLNWKFDESSSPGVSLATENNRLENGRKKGSVEKKVRTGEVFVSARKLAAGLWQFKLPEQEASGIFGVGHLQDSVFPPGLGFEPVVGHVKTSYLCNSNGTDHIKESKDRLHDPHLVPHPRKGLGYKLEPSVTFLNSVMERATKWDPGGCPKTSDQVYRFYGHLKFLQDQQDTTVSIVSTLQAELEQARTHIHELETERQSTKKKVEHFLRKLTVERASWRSREHEKIHSVFENVKDELNREKKQRQRMEIMNTKLVNELADAKLSAKRFLQDYEKERKARELMEEVCDELAKEIGEDKAEVEDLKRESMKIREEVEEERKMLQMAEVWREERVQMKLVDAKLTLEEKYQQLSKLQADLEDFLRSRGTSDVVEIREAELLQDTANSVKIHEVQEFLYQPPTSEDVFSVFEDLHSAEANGKEIEFCVALTPDLAGYSPSSRTSKAHTVSPHHVNGYHENSTQRYTALITYQNGNLEDGSVWDSASPGDEQGSSNSPDRSDPSVNGCGEKTNGSRSGTDWEENGDTGAQNMETGSFYSASLSQSKKKISSISRLWRSSNGDPYKTISAEITNGRISNRLVSPDRISGNGTLSPQSLGHWSSPDSVNPHITRGMKGCIEWSRGIQKSSLKSKLLEARMESQKIQLRHVLKQKI